MSLNFSIRYVSTDGHFTPEGMIFFTSLAQRLEAAEAKLTSIAAIAAPVGGATVDAEARAAIAAIIAA